MACLIKNIPKNSIVSFGNTGALFPVTARECYFEAPTFECILALEESSYVNLLTEQRKRMGISCPVRIDDCYFAMQEDGFTSFTPQESENDYLKAPCI